MALWMAAVFWLLAVSTVRGAATRGRRQSFLLDMNNGITYQDYSVTAFGNHKHHCPKAKEKTDKSGRCLFLRNTTAIMNSAVEDAWVMVGQVESEVVDCAHAKERCQEEAVEVYPMLKLYRNGEAVISKREGNWTTRDIVTWLLEGTMLGLHPSQSDIPTYTSSAASATPEECHEGCIECDVEDDLRCRKCLEGWGQTDPYASSCSECSEGCLNCNNEDLVCYVCRSGYIRIHDPDNDTFYCRRNDQQS